MSDDLVKQGRSVERDLNNGFPMTCERGRIIQRMADRIEELEAKLKTSEEIGRAFEEDAGQLRAKLAKQDDLIKERSDEVQAAVVAALTEAAECCTAQLRNTAMLMSNPPQSSAAWDARNAILALITPDAQAALDRVVAAERERCARVAESVALPMDGRNAKAQADYMSKVIARVIREGESDFPVNETREDRK